MSTPTQNPLGYLGIDVNNPRQNYVRERDPTPNDIRPYILGDRWVNKQNGTAWMLVQKSTTAALWSPIGGGTSQLSQLTGNDAIPVNPVGGNINLLGISGINLTNTAPATITANNLRDFGRFVVSSTPGESEYSSIQAALNAAAGTNEVVYVLPGTYTENLTFPSQCMLVGLVSNPIDNKVEVVGDHIANAGTSKIQVMGIRFSSTSFAFTSTTGSPEISFYQCEISGTIDGVRSIDPSGSTLTFIECNITGGTRGIIGDLGSVITTSRCNITGGSSYIGGRTAVLLCDNTTFNGGANLNDTSFMSAKYCIFNGGAVSCVDLTAPGTELRSIYCEFKSTNPATFILNGVGTLRKALIIATDSATVIGPGLTTTTYPSF